VEGRRGKRRVGFPREGEKVLAGGLLQQYSTRDGTNKRLFLKLKGDRTGVVLYVTRQKSIGPSPVH